MQGVYPDVACINSFSGKISTGRGPEEECTTLHAYTASNPLAILAAPRFHVDRSKF